MISTRWSAVTSYQTTTTNNWRLCFTRHGNIKYSVKGEWPSLYQSQHMTIFSYHYNTFSLSLVDWQVFVWLSTKMEVLFMLKSVRPIIFFLWKWEAVSLNNTFCCWDLSDMLLPVSREVAKQKLLQKFTTKLHTSTVAQTAAVTEVIDVLQCKQWPLFLVFYFQYNLYFLVELGKTAPKCKTQHKEQLSHKINTAPFQHH